MNCTTVAVEAQEDYITTERVAIVVHRLTLGRKFTTKEVSALTGINRHSAWSMLCKISRVLPLCYEDGYWVMYMNGGDI